MMQILGKDTVYGIIGFQIFRRVSVFRSKDQLVALLLRKGELGMEERTDFSETPRRPPKRSFSSLSGKLRATGLHPCWRSTRR